MRLWWLPVAVGVIPLMTLHICHWINVQAGHLPACVPYWAGCVSISAAGRYDPGNHLFDALVTPMGLALSVYWCLAARWIRIIQNQAGFFRPLVYFGCVAGVFMTLYAVFLGVETGYGRSLRRLGINAYFFFNMTCQVLLVVQLRRLLPPADKASLARLLKWILTAAIFVGLLSGVENLLPDNNQIDNIIEWNFALFMSLHFLVVAALWRKYALHLPLGTLTADGE